MMIPLDQIIPVVATFIAGVFAYLVRYYFSGLRKDIKSVQKDVARTSGHIDALATELRANTVQLAITSTEIRALWRTVDGAYERTSDKNGDHR